MTGSDLKLRFKLCGLQFILLLVLFNVGFVVNQFPQNLKCSAYDNEDGLSSNLVKSVVQDSAGYIWIASDAGLTRFDGKRFVTFSTQFPSLFLKDVLIDPHKRLIVTTDLGVGYFTTKGQKYEFRSIARGLSYDTDTTLLYPKAVFMDRRENIWISEQNSVSKIKDKQFKKYRFEQKDYSDSYNKSFQFAEDKKGNLYVFSWRGYLYRYNPRDDNFERLSFNPPSPNFNINEVQVMSDNSIWCATSDGLFRFEIKDGKVNYETRIPGRVVSSFRYDKKGNLYFGTWVSGCYIQHTSTGAITHIDNLPFRSINDLYIDREGAVWVSSDDGLAILKETYFAAAEYSSGGESSTAYVINVISDQGSVYFSDQDIIYRVVPAERTHKYERVIDSRNKRVYNFDVSKGNIWVSYRNGELEYFPAGGSRRSLSKYIKGRINAVTITDDNSVWGFSESSKEFVNIKNETQVNYYSTGEYKPEYIRVIESTENGDVYFCGNGKNSFFFKYSGKDNRVYNLSSLFNFIPDIQITIYDIHAEPDGSLLIASSLGLFNYSSSKVTALSKPDQSFIVKAIQKDETGRLWLGSEKGLVMMSEGQFTSYYKQDGLPNSTISERAIAFDKDQRVWVGTASGLAYWQNLSVKTGNTPRPYILKVMISGREKTVPEIKQLVGNVDFETEFISLSYPDRMEYQTRLIGFENEWSDPGSHNSIRYTNLPPNDYTLQVRARQSGYFWSPITELTFSVRPPWYRTWWMYIIYVISAVIVVFLISVAQHRKKIRKLNERQKELERVVSERTKDLNEEKETTLKLLKETEKAKKEIERVNDDLRNANQLKSDLLSIAAHDLKNPLSSIIGFSRMIKDENENPQVSHMVNIIYESSLRMLKLIADILDSVTIESSKLKLNVGSFDISELCRKVVENNIHTAKMKNQRISTNIAEQIIINGDEKWLREALDNVLSNAIKYSPKGKNIYVNLEDPGKCVKFSVRDEGPGLTEDDKKNLFQKFTRLSAQPTGGESSTGLGLSIVKEIITLHNGKIWAESQYGNGSTFIIELRKDFSQ